jgi:hypothetical protein
MTEKKLKGFGASYKKHVYGIIESIWQVIGSPGLKGLEMVR